MALLTLAIPLMFAGGGAWLLAAAGPRVVEGVRARSWPPAAGRIVEARIEPMPGAAEHGSNRKAWFGVPVVYEYSVNGRTFRNDRYALATAYHQSYDARRIAEGWRPGLAVTVYHDPGDPARSLIDRRIGGGTWAMVGLGLPLAALGGLMLVGFARGVRRGGWGDERPAA